MIQCVVKNTKWPVSVHYLENTWRTQMHKGMEGNVRELGARRAVAQMERADLEDKHLNLMEENLVNISPVERHITLFII